MTAAAAAGWTRIRGSCCPAGAGTANREAAAGGPSALFWADTSPQQTGPPPPRTAKSRPLGGRPGQGQEQPLSGDHPRRALQPPHAIGGPARRLRRQKHRRSRRRAGPPARGHGPHPRPGPGNRDGPMGRHRKNPGHRGVLLRPPLPPATTRQRAEQRPTPTPAAQKHRPPHPSSAPAHNRGQPQHHAPQTPPPAISPNHPHCPQQQPPTELAAQRAGARRKSQVLSHPNPIRTWGLIVQKVGGMRHWRQTFGSL